MSHVVPPPQDWAKAEAGTNGVYLGFSVSPPCQIRPLTIQLPALRFCRAPAAASRVLKFRLSVRRER